MSVLLRSPPSAGSSLLVSVEPLAAEAAEPLMPTSYRVQSGDTLYSVARRFGVTVEQIKSWNSLKANTVQTGQSLTLVAGAVQSEPAAGLMRVSMPARTVAAKSSTYTIRNGDTLFGIAIKFGVELADLMRWNKLTARSVIQPGARIRVAAL